MPAAMVTWPSMTTSCTAGVGLTSTEGVVDPVSAEGVAEVVAAASGVTVGSWGTGV